MKIEIVIGLILLTVVSICGTILLSKRFEIAYAERIEKKRIEADERNQREQIRMDCAANNWAALYQDEHDKLIQMEQVNKRLKKQLQNAEKLLSKVRVADL